MRQAEAQLNGNGFKDLVRCRRPPDTYSDPAFIGVLFFHGRFPIICSGRPFPQRTRSLKTFLLSCVTLLVGHSPGAWQYHMFSNFPDYLFRRRMAYSDFSMHFGTDCTRRKARRADHATQHLLMQRLAAFSAERLPCGVRFPITRVGLQLAWSPSRQRPKIKKCAAFPLHSV